MKGNDLPTIRCTLPTSQCIALTLVSESTIIECEEPGTELHINQIMMQFDASNTLIISILANPLSLSLICVFGNCEVGDCAHAVKRE